MQIQQKESVITTILIDYKNQSIHADRRLTITGHKNTTGVVGYLLGRTSTSETETRGYLDDIDKIHPLGEDRYFVGTGDVSVIDKACHTLKKGDSLEDPVKLGATILVVSKKGDGLQVNEYKVVQVPFKWWQSTPRFKWKHTYHHRTEGCHSAGCGSEYAAGAFQVTNCGIEAIKAASYLDEYTNDNIQSVYLGVDNSEN